MFLHTISSFPEYLPVMSKKWQLIENPLLRTSKTGSGSLGLSRYLKDEEEKMGKLFGVVHPLLTLFCGVEISGNFVVLLVISTMYRSRAQSYPLSIMGCNATMSWYLVLRKQLEQVGNPNFL
jgi:hypothetical protein